jgi:glycosyltransferase involved in cell wall biosynthesis
MKVAIVVPCLNEELTVAKVVADSRRNLPDARVYVLDNGSVDQTAALARQAGAEVIHSPLRGKGHVLRQAIRLIDADYFIMVDGDGTYPMEHASALLQIAIDCNYEMVMGSRLQMGKTEAFRPLHFLGNVAFTFMVRLLFGFPVKDLLTGFRVFSRRFVNEVHFVSNGFEIETELTIRAIAQNMAFVEVPIPYIERPTGSRSKLRTFRDGWIILRTVFRLLRGFRPLLFFTPLAALLLALATLAPAPLASAFTMASALLLTLGFFLSTRLDLERFKLRESRTDERPTARLQKSA